MWGLSAASAPPAWRRRPSAPAARAQLRAAGRSPPSAAFSKRRFASVGYRSGLPSSLPSSSAEDLLQSRPLVRSPRFKLLQNDLCFGRAKLLEDVAQPPSFLVVVKRGRRLSALLCFPISCPLRVRRHGESFRSQLHLPRSEIR